MHGKVIKFSHTKLSDIGINTHAQIDAYIEAGASRLLTSVVRNQTGQTLTKGTVVYVSGASGNKPLVSKAQANSEATSSKTYGVVKEDILTNSNGEAVFIGEVVGLDTLAYAEGSILWLSPTVAGGFTTTKPVAPNHSVYVALVTRSHQTQGTIEVRIANGYEIEELHNVLIANPTNGQVIAFDSADSLYKNITLTKSSVGLSNVDNTSDLSKPISTATQTALDAKESTANKNQNNGYAGLDSSGKLNPSQLPAIAVTDTNVVASQTAMLALTAEVGDLAVRTDLNKTFILRVSPASTLGNWQELLTPTDSVASVYGRTGIVTAQSGDYTADQITETASNKILTSTERTKLSGIATGATANSTDAQLRDRSTHTGTQLANTISDFASTVLATVLTGLSLATSSVISATDTVLVALGKLQAQVTSLSSSKQDNLVSGTNIKTVNTQSILGSGDITIGGSAAWGGITGTLSTQTDLQSALNAKQNTLVSATNIKTINGASVLGSGDLTVTGSGGISNNQSIVNALIFG
jgi:hypothetical protein